ncbi:hypothetical protein LHP98_10315 [Rhodobacter sp. Har01]|uniref:hypothetical protein n=1 Tax=Rhodobacter sp. Har01 TaxID=2883999 RepID=UPI001D06EDB4|nr:hypothetical protein [Rhodobacter sp. Har01]MCB6178525.1 hypothetical protein [Rhodobacter sp. Har01]
MRLSVLAAVFALLPGMGLAERSPLSAEIASSGIAATEARLAGLPDPTPPDLFALAGLHFLSGVERALQLRWQTGMQADWSELPILRLPIPENPAARAFTGTDLVDLLTGLAADMDAARAALDRLGPRDFALEIAMADLWFDINMNATRDEGEGIGDVALNAIGGRRAAVDVLDPAIRFDTADAAWLSAYTHFLSAFANLALAYDPGPAVDRVSASAKAMKEMWGPTPPSNAFDMMFGRQVDRVAMILMAAAQQPDPALTRAAHGHLLAMITENRRFWALLRSETDNAGEWVPNDRQTSALGLFVPDGTGDRWLAVLDEAEQMLKGDRLAPHWRYGADAGINVAKLFENPPAIDLVAMVQGQGFLSYAETGTVMSLGAWRDFERLVQGDSMLFAVFLN